MILDESGQFVQPTNFLNSQVPEQGGKSQIFSCTSNGLNCSCTENSCSGTDSYCTLQGCTPNNACFCSLLPSSTKLLHRQGTTIITNPKLISYHVCKHRISLNIHHSHTRRLLSNENAVFKENGIEISFKDPIFTSSHHGSLITRIHGQEFICQLRSTPLQCAIPQELLTDPGVLKITFISSSGDIVQGTIQLEGHLICPRTECLFCPQLFYHIKCLPPSLAYTIYTLIVLLSAITFIYVKTVLTGIIKVIYAIYAVARRLLWMSKQTSYLAVKTGAMTGNFIRTQAGNIAQFVDRNAHVPAPANILPYLAFAILTLCMPYAQPECTNHNIIASKAKECHDLGTNNTCKIYTNVQMTLMNIDYSSCLWFTDSETDKNLFSLKVKFGSAKCTWQSHRLYYTFKTHMHSISYLACPNTDACGWGSHCRRGKAFPALTKQSLSFPGVTDCSPADSGTTSCFIIDSSPCLFFRWWLEPDYTHVYEVHRLTSYTCEYELEITQRSNNTVEKVHIKNQAQTSQGIHLQIVGAFNQVSPILHSHLIYQVANNQVAYLEKASERNRPKTREVGDVQANTSVTKDFIFDPDMVSCSFYEEQMTCAKEPSYLEHMIERKDSALPMTIAYHHLKVDAQGRLTSTLLQSAPLVINLQFNGYMFTTQTKTVCAKFTDADIRTTGCHSCNVLATIKFEAHSTCSPGMVDVTFENILVATRSIYLSTKQKIHTIKFHAPSKCINDKICLVGRTITSCKTIQFCLMDPSLELTQPNFTYIHSHATSNSQVWSTSWMSAMFNFNVFSNLKLILAILTAAITFLFTVSTLITCCRS